MNTKLTKPLDLVNKPILLEDLSEKIVYINKEASKCFGNFEGENDNIKFLDHFTFFRSDDSICISSHTGDVFFFLKELTTIKDQTYNKITLTPLSETVDPRMMESYLLMTEKFVHQFRSPLTGAYGFLELYLEEYEEDPKNYLSRMAEGLNQSFFLLDQIEDFARTVSVEYSKFSLDSFLVAIKESFNKSEIDEIFIQVPDNKYELHSDFYLLRKIVIELLKNGLEANEIVSGKKVSFRFTEEGIIEVQNKLPEMAKSRLNQFFFPFYSTKALQVGLGLPKCQRYCKMLDLTLKVKYDLQQNNIIFQVNGLALSDE